MQRTGRAAAGREPVNDANWMTQMKKGLIELCILNLLDRESMYGYQIVKHLTEFPGLVISEGTVYPLLSRLRKDGLLSSTLVESAAGPVRRNYVLTAAGRRQLKLMNEAWREVADAVGRLMASEGT
jgi:PadR family transcriptional regulator PadR